MNIIIYLIMLKYVLELIKKVIQKQKTTKK